MLYQLEYLKSLSSYDLFPAKCYSMSLLNKDDIEKLLKYKNDEQYLVKIPINKSDFFYLIKCYEKNMLKTYTSLANKRRFSSKYSEQVINKFLNWQLIYSNIQLENEQIKIPEELLDTLEIEMYLLLELYNGINWDYDSLYLIIE